MNLNVFRHGKAVASAFEKPNVLLALVLVGVAIALAGVNLVLNASAPDWNVFLVESVLKEYARFIALGILIFIAGMVLNRQNMKGKFTGVFSALGLTYVITIIVSVLSLVIGRLVFKPEFLHALGQAKTFEEMAMTALLWSSADPSAVNWTLLTVALVIGALLLVYQLFLVYKIISFVSKHRPWLNLIALIAILVVFGTLIFTVL